MYYKISVTKVESNPAFDPNAVEEYRRMQREYPYRNAEPPDERAELGTRQLDVTLTDEEFQAIKQAVMQVWK